MVVVYVACPYTGREDDGVRMSIIAASMLVENGFAPIVPLLFHYVNEHQSFAYETWMETDLCLLNRCDAMLRLPGQSTGMDREQAFAMDRGIPVFTNIKDLINDFKNMEVSST